MSYADRIARVRQRMVEQEIDALLLSVGPDLPYLTGYEAMPLERLTMLVLPRTGDATLVVPRLEAPRVETDGGLFELIAWDETEDAVALVAKQIRRARTIAIGDHTWARFVLALQQALPSARWLRGHSVTNAVRMVKDADEIMALQDAANAVDAIAVAMRSQPFAGRREFEVHREIVERMLDAGHQKANFAIVASGPNAASPHHEPGNRMIAEGDVVLCDFGGTMNGYCSDITRMFHVGAPSAEVRDAYSALVAAQEAAVQTARAGTRCEDVDRAARRVLGAAGLADWFVHRTGHGIGTEAHEDPYIVAGNRDLLDVGHVFSVEPGVYFPGRFGLRLEDIVVAGPAGPIRLNKAPRALAIVG
jgi:Xaa-Pro aminopeptidase